MQGFLSNPRPEVKYGLFVFSFLYLPRTNQLVVEQTVATAKVSFCIMR